MPETVFTPNQRKWVRRLLALIGVLILIGIILAVAT